MMNEKQQRAAQAYARKVIEADRQASGEPVKGEQFVRAWVNLEKLPGSMMVGAEGRFGPVPGTTTCWITTSETEVERLKAQGPVLEIWTTPQPQQQVGEPITEAIKRITDFIERRKQIRGLDQAEIMALDGCEYALLTEDLIAVCAAATQPKQIPKPHPWSESMVSNHRSFAEGWNACRKAMI